MRIVESLPRAVREIEHCWIPLSDGCRLAARIWLPDDAELRPVPAILEYIPYGKREGTRVRDEPMHGYFAGHGYAAVRVDVRGSGDSEGVLRDEYLEQEQLDGVEVIQWIASQPWCSGAVGMIGKSWGGFNVLQLAARRPAALRAVISVCASDDRYADDAHYMGGCLLVENIVWGSALFGLVAQPPDPELVGECWREMWRARLENAWPFSARWLEHPMRDDYWRQGSVCEDFSRITCPVYAIGGWADGYSNAVPRLLAGLRGPRKGLVGPWAHVYPHEGVPGPAIGFLQEALRWWEQWLSGRDTGVLQEPMYRVWMQESAAPRTFYRERAGRWVAEDVWPSPRIRLQEFELGAGRLGDVAPEASPVTGISPETTGLAAGAWCGFGMEGEMPSDQREDDAHSLCFDSDPLAQGFEILGAPRVRLALSVDRPRAFVVVRLEEVARDGASARVSYGVLNLEHREGHERLAPIEPGAPMAVEVVLNDVAHGFAAGHRLRVAVSTRYWPLVWPSAEPVTLTILRGRLALPVRPPRAEDAALAPFAPPEGAPRPAVVDLHPGGVRRTIERDVLTGEVVHTTALDLDESGEPALSRMEPIDLEVGYGIVERLRIREGDPLSARAELEHKSVSRRGDWSVRVETRTCLTSTKDTFRLEAALRAFADGREVFHRRFDERIPRRGV